MVIRVDPVLPGLAAQDLGGAVGNHLVGVHVVAGAGARLEWIDDELVIPAPFDHLLRRLDDRLRPVVVEQAQVAVDFRRGALDGRHRPDKCPPGAQTRDREIEYGALRSARRKARLWELGSPPGSHVSIRYSIDCFLLGIQCNTAFWSDFHSIP